jgi:hypothetical protein
MKAKDGNAGANSKRVAFGKETVAPAATPERQKSPATRPSADDDEDPKPVRAKSQQSKAKASKRSNDSSPRPSKKKKEKAKASKRTSRVSDDDEEDEDDEGYNSDDMREEEGDEDDDDDDDEEEEEDDVDDASEDEEEESSSSEEDEPLDDESSSSSDGEEEEEKEKPTPRPSKSSKASAAVATASAAAAAATSTNTTAGVSVSTNKTPSAVVNGIWMKPKSENHGQPRVVLNLTDAAMQQVVDTLSVYPKGPYLTSRKPKEEAKREQPIVMQACRLAMHKQSAEPVYADGDGGYVTVHETLIPVCNFAKAPTPPPGIPSTHWKSITIETVSWLVVQPGKPFPAALLKRLGSGRYECKSDLLKQIRRSHYTILFRTTAATLAEGDGDSCGTWLMLLSCVLPERDGVPGGLTHFFCVKTDAAMKLSKHALATTSATKPVVPDNEVWNLQCKPITSTGNVILNLSLVHPMDGVDQQPRDSPPFQMLPVLDPQAFHLDQKKKQNRSAAQEQKRKQAADAMDEDGDASESNSERDTSTERHPNKPKKKKSKERVMKSKKDKKKKKKEEKRLRKEEKRRKKEEEKNAKKKKKKHHEEEKAPAAATNKTKMKEKSTDAVSSITKESGTPAALASESKSNKTASSVVPEPKSGARVAPEPKSGAPVALASESKSNKTASSVAPEPTAASVRKHKDTTTTERDNEQPTQKRPKYQRGEWSGFNGANPEDEKISDAPDGFCHRTLPEVEPAAVAALAPAPVTTTTTTINPAPVAPVAREQAPAPMAIDSDLSCMMQRSVEMVARASARPEPVVDVSPFAMLSLVSDADPNCASKRQLLLNDYKHQSHTLMVTGAMTPLPKWVKQFERRMQLYVQGDAPTSPDAPFLSMLSMTVIRERFQQQAGLAEPPSDSTALAMSWGNLKPVITAHTWDINNMFADPLMFPSRAAQLSVDALGVLVFMADPVCRNIIQTSARADPDHLPGCEELIGASQELIAVEMVRALTTQPGYQNAYMLERQLNQARAALRRVFCEHNPDLLKERLQRLCYIDRVVLALLATNEGYLRLDRVMASFWDQNRLIRLV